MRELGAEAEGVQLTCSPSGKTQRENSDMGRLFDKVVQHLGGINEGHGQDARSAMQQLTGEVVVCAQENDFGMLNLSCARFKGAPQVFHSTHSCGATIIYERRRKSTTKRRNNKPCRTH
jgi:hypothetical protein